MNEVSLKFSTVIRQHAPTKHDGGIRRLREAIIGQGCTKQKEYSETHSPHIQPTALGPPAFYLRRAREEKFLKGGANETLQKATSLRSF